MPTKWVELPRLCLRRMLLDEFTRLNAMHQDDMRKIGSKVPIGGAHMDLFFRVEGLYAVLTSLRLGLSIEESIQAGKEASTAAVKLWNSQREWQVHRWENTAHDFIERTVYNFCKIAVIDRT